MHGHRYAVSAGARKTQLREDGSLLVLAQGGRVVVRDFLLDGRQVSFSVKADAPTTITVFPREGGRPVQVRVPAGTTDVRR